jgi:hypothetical protein
MRLSGLTCSGGIRRARTAVSWAAQEFQQVFRESLRVQDVADVLLSRQHEQPSVQRSNILVLMFQAVLRSVSAGTSASPVDGVNRKVLLEVGE